MKTTSRILALLLAVLMALSVFAMAGCDEADDKANNEKETEKTEGSKKDNNATDRSGFFGTDWINAQDFGMVGDGVTPNDRKMADYIKYYSETPLYFPAGVYAFERSLDFPNNMYLELDPEAELLCIAKEPLECFISVRKDVSDWCTLDKYSKSYIRGGTINVNYCAKIGIGVCQCYHSQFEGFTLKNVLEKGIQTLYNTTDFADGAFTGEDLVIYNDRAIPGTYGIYDCHFDTNVSSTSIVNFETGIYTWGGRFYECSVWNTKMDYVENLTFAEIARGNQTLFDNCSVDTVRYGFKIKGDASCQIMNMTWITNTTFYTPQLQMKYPRTIFQCENPGKARVYAVNISLPAEQCISFANGEMRNSIFLNTRVPDGYDAERIMKYFRNDTEELLDLVFSK